MNVFPRRSQDGISTPRTPQGASAPSTRSSTIHDQSARLFPDTDGVDPVRQPAGSRYQTTENMVNGFNPVATNYGSPSGSLAYDDVEPQSIPDTVMASREGRLVAGSNNDDRSSNGASVSGEQDTIPPQTPAPTSTTPANTSTGSNLAVNTPHSQTVSSFESTGFPPPLNPRSMVADSQINQPPVTQPADAHRHRSRFTNWLRRHRTHRHGPWNPFNRHNWNAVSDAIREVERRGFGPSRRSNIDGDLIIDQE